MLEHMTRAEVLATVREKMGSRGAGLRAANMVRVSKAAGNKWLREGIPRERVALFSAITGLPPHVIRPDEFVPPLQGDTRARH